jgi:hypothetical protein
VSVKTPPSGGVFVYLENTDFRAKQKPDQWPGFDITCYVGFISPAGLVLSWEPVLPGQVLKWKPVAGSAT